MSCLLKHLTRNNVHAWSNEYMKFMYLSCGFKQFCSTGWPLHQHRRDQGLSPVQAWFFQIFSSLLLVALNNCEDHLHWNCFSPQFKYTKFHVLITTYICTFTIFTGVLFRHFNQWEKTYLHKWKITITYACVRDRQSAADTSLAQFCARNECQREKSLLYHVR